MDAGKNSITPHRSDLLAAGFQAGMAGAIVLLAWLGATSILYRRAFWHAPNLIGSLFYGESALRARFSPATLAGIAVYLLMYSLVGVLFAALLKGNPARARVVLLGVLAGVAWFYVAFRFIWYHVNPLIPLYTSDGPMVAGHVIYGAMIGRLSRFLPQPEVVQPPQVDTGETAAAVEDPQTDAKVIFDN